MVASTELEVARASVAAAEPALAWVQALASEKAAAEASAVDCIAWAVA